MIIAVLVQGQQIAPWQNSSLSIILVDASEGNLTNRKHYWIDEPSLSSRIKKFQELRINTLICGTIPQKVLTILQKIHVQVIRDVEGNMHRVFRDYLRGNISFTDDDHRDS